jgi:hypothetical protein
MKHFISHFRILFTQTVRASTLMIGNVQKCIPDVDRDCEAHFFVPFRELSPTASQRAPCFLKTLSKPNAAGGQIDTVSQKAC